MSKLPPPMNLREDFPLGTTVLTGLIGFTSLFCILLGGGRESGLLLTHGQSLYFWQWITSLLVVPGLFALVFHLIFLWIIGQIVEGRLGDWRKFAGMALVPAVGLAMLEQIFTLWSGKLLPSSSTSRLIYSLAGMALMWSPGVSVEFPGEYFSRRAKVPGFSLPAWIWIMIYIGLDAFLSQQIGSYSGPPFVNVVALGMGLGIAYMAIQKQPFEEPGDDLPTLLMDAMISRKFRSDAYEPLEEEVAPARKKKKNSGKSVEADADEEEEKPRTKPSVRMIQAFNTMVEGGNSQGALNQVELIRQLIPDWQIPEEALRKIIDQTQQLKLWHLCIPLMEEYTVRFEADADTVRLRLAKILIDEQQRPRHALRILSKIPPDRLGEEMEKTRCKIEQAALTQIEEGVLELESGGWEPNQT